MQDGSSASVGKLSDTLLDLKTQVFDVHGIPIKDQTYFLKRGTKDTEISDDWRCLSDYGIKSEDTLLLVIRDPWYRLEYDEAETLTIHLSMPTPCVQVFERILDFMYNYRCSDDSCFRQLGDLSPSTALGAFWLAGHLDIPDLQRHLIALLERTATPPTAHAYLATAAELGQAKVLATLTRLASQSLSSLPAGACDGLPLEVVDGLLQGGWSGRARGAVLVSYLRAREAEGRLDEALYRRLMRRHPAPAQPPQSPAGRAGAAAGDAAGGGEGGGGGGAGEGLATGGGGEEAISAEDAVLLLGVARRFGDAEVEGRCLRRAAGGFSGLDAGDLARMPARVVQEMLSDDELEVSEQY